MRRNPPSGVILPLGRFLLCVLGMVAPASMASPPAIAAPSYLLVETRSGAILAEQRADERRAPASLTKLMTAYVLFTDLRTGRLRLDEHAVVSTYAARLPGARMFLTAGESVAIEDLLKGMLVQSGNDATATLIEHAAGNLPAFVARMNAEARRLGLNDTHFENATGLHRPAHYSTARDLARLAIALQNDFPEHRHFFALREFTWAGITQPNRNRLLRSRPDVHGLKTGHTEAAGYCLAASADSDTMQLVAVVLGSDSDDGRHRDARRLLDHGFRDHETRRLHAAGAVLATLPVWMGAEDSVALGLADDLWLTLPRGGFDRLQSHLSLPASVEAPLPRARAIGELQLSFDGRPLRALPLVALNDVVAGSLARRGVDRLRLWFHNRAIVSTTPVPARKHGDPQPAPE